MSLYNNTRKDSPIQSVEFASNPVGGMAFFRLNAQTDTQEVKQWIASLGNQVILAETQVAGHPVLVTSGTKTQDEILSALAARGENLAQQIDEKKFNPWWWRGFTSFVGQSLMLVSGFRSVDNTDKGSLITFASTNLAANVGNMVFGAQRKDDPHQLQVLEQKVDATLAPYLPANKAPSGAQQSAATAATQMLGDKDQPFGGSVGGFLRRHSVSFMEIGLRTLGSVALMTPLRQLNKDTGKYEFKWGEAARELFKGNPTAAYNAVKQKRDFTRHYGELMVTGKLISFLSKEPDPYNPKPHTWLDTVREKWTFRASSVLEGFGAAIGAWDSFRKKKIKIGSKIMPDFVGGLGNVVFIGGYIIRWFAPYGSREVNMDALNAYTSAALANVPREKLPQAMADVAGMLATHFEGKRFRGKNDKVPRPLTLTDIYTDMSTPLDSPQKEPAQAQAQSPAMSPAVTQEKRFTDTVRRNTGPAAIAMA